MTNEQAEQPPVRGLVASKYELVGLIGRGGMGSVWEGRHVSLGTHVAIKFIESELAASAEARARFDNEARAAAALQTKHAIQIFDHGVTDDGKPYIVMEMLRGEPLDRRLARVGRLGPAEIARIVQQVCRALSRAHESGIIHRDLKPENIFLVRSPDEDDEVAKVLDFGIAKFKQPMGAQAISSSTRTGTVLGTPYYMSPEQARGLRTVDHRSDLWSLGVIVFRCLTGVLPFDGESLGDLLVKICTAPVPVPSLALPGIPPSVDAWVQRALEREPSLRFATAQELSDALAFACGISVRRGVFTDPNQAATPAASPSQLSVRGTAYATPPGVHPYATPPGMRPNVMPSVPPGSPSVTQSPLVASAQRGIPKGPPVAALLVSGMLVLGVVGAGAVALTKLGASRATTAASTAPSAPASVLSATPSATPSETATHPLLSAAPTTVTGEPLPIARTSTPPGGNTGHKTPRAPASSGPTPTPTPTPTAPSVPPVPTTPPAPKPPFGGPSAGY